jgi:plasmid stabilization system protein ParE
MKWTVLWSPLAEKDLTSFWVSAEDKAEVTEAANRIDFLLRNDPLKTGESREGDDRIHFESPLGVFFSVAEEERLVLVLRIWRIR